MILQLGKEIDHIRAMIIEMATLVEEAVRNANEAFLKLNIELAHSVIYKDSEINSMELKIDKEVFECLALKAPVASDLRFLFAIQKINKDLERIGDHAVNIAQSAINCNNLQQPMVGPDIEFMVSCTINMLSDSINSIVKLDTQLALKVLEQDDQVDNLNKSITREVIKMVKKNAASVEGALELLRVSKNLERIADLSTNISEDVIFHANAKDIKHAK